MPLVEGSPCKPLLVAAGPQEAEDKERKERVEAVEVQEEQEETVLKIQAMLGLAVFRPSKVLLMGIH